MNEENKWNNRAKLLMAGIAVVLILIICGISVVINALGKRNEEDLDSKLQSDIIEYANSGQTIGTQETETVKEEQTELTQEESKKEEPSKEESSKEESSKEGSTDAMVVADVEKPADKTIMEEQKELEEKKKAEGVKTPETEKKTEENLAYEQKTTAKWHKEVNEDLSKVEMDLSRQMAEMKGYWEAGNMAAVEDLAYLPRYRAASMQLKGTKKYYYLGDLDEKQRPHGKGLAMYTDNQYYYGEWQNGVRCGGGMWIKFYVYDKNAKAKESIWLQHSYSGTWSNDLPNGEGAEHYDFIDENLEEKVGYNRNFIGNFKNGLYHGEMYITNYYKDGNVKEWMGTAVNGEWETMGDMDRMGQYPVIVETKDSENYQWMKAAQNKNQGVKDLISAAK